MGWIKNMTLKKSFLAIIIVSLIAAIVLSIMFSGLCNVLIDHFDLYVTVPATAGSMDSSEVVAPDNSAVVITGEDETQTTYQYVYKVEPWYSILSSLQIAMPVVFVIAALICADIIFYRLKLKRPIAILQDGAERIQKQDLDFEITGYASDELGELCSAFEIMRKTLLSNNRELWRQAEERKRLNAAFSHDLRNPVTVLKGSAKLLQKDIESGRLNAENGKEPVELVCQYAGRIEHYVEIMTSAQKLEELECKRLMYSKEDIQSELQNSLTLLSEASGKKITITHSGTAAKVSIDKQFVYNTAENLVSNALRYAKNKVIVEMTYQENQIILTVCDDGNGFPDSILKKGITPFSRDKTSDNEHFGMGLYICKLLCEKHGGSLEIGNTEHGGKATAVFIF
jgi:signal transduction histidine kinase